MCRIREEFDRIALVTESHGSPGNIYHDYLLRHVPPRCENVLEIGCGTGEFARLLAARARKVVAVDFSPQMIRLARARSVNQKNIEYLLGDVMRLSLAGESYDCIFSIATLHHLPQSQALLKMKGALKADGRLIIHDLVTDDGFIDGIKSALAYPFNAAWRFWKTGRMRAPRAAREAWEDHGRGEVYPTMNEVREMCGRYLPSARVQRHLLWRYTVVWSKHGAA